MTHPSRIAMSLVFAVSVITAAYPADEPAVARTKVLGNIRVIASPGDNILVARHHHHEYVYLAHAGHRSVEVFEVSDPRSPRQLSGPEAKHATRNAQAAVISMSAAGTARVLDLSNPDEPRIIGEFPDAIAATTDGHNRIYVLDQNSLRIIAIPTQLEENGDDSWFRNAMTPG